MAHVLLTCQAPLISSYFSTSTSKCLLARECNVVLERYHSSWSSSISRKLCSQSLYQAVIKVCISKLLNQSQTILTHITRCTHAKCATIIKHKINSSLQYKDSVYISYRRKIKLLHRIPSAGGEACPLAESSLMGNNFTCVSLFKIITQSTCPQSAFYKSISIQGLSIQKATQQHVSLWVLLDQVYSGSASCISVCWPLIFPINCQVVFKCSPFIQLHGCDHWMIVYTIYNMTGYNQENMIDSLLYDKLLMTSFEILLAMCILGYRILFHARVSLLATQNKCHKLHSHLGL